MAKGDALPREDETTRWIKFKFIGKDDDGNVEVDAKGCPITVAPHAFELDQDEDGLSLTWLQSFGTERAEHLPAAADAVRQSQNSKKLSANSAFAIGEVGALISAGQDCAQNLRVLHDPIHDNKGHTEVRRYPHDVGDLQMQLANRIFNERYLYADVRKIGWRP